MKEKLKTFYGIIITSALIARLTLPVYASSFGTLTNFDTVNDTGEECHGFEIEMEDCHSTDITRTYNYNHYGTPNITEDNSDPNHPRCIIRWEARKLEDGTWSAYTAIPNGPIDPTNGHQFTNPNVNFGGEHFGVSYRNVPTNVRYFWLIDRNGLLVRGTEEVKISTPKFIYNPAARNVVARIEPPEPLEVHKDEFGPAIWIKSIKTVSHNNRELELRDLRSDDPDDPDDVNWKNGEEDEVEVEWELMQEEFEEDGEGQGDPLEGAPEDIPEGDEIITRRWEFYEYTGPYDPENHEALADKVAPDSMHGVGTKTVNSMEFDLANTVVVGNFIGAQMAAFDVDPELELSDHLQDGKEGVAYPNRTVVIVGGTPFTSTVSGTIPTGMNFDKVTGILSGTPNKSGEFQFTVEASDTNTPLKSRTYNLRIAKTIEDLPPLWRMDAIVAPGLKGGTISGGGNFNNGELVSFVATADEGYRFAGWTELGTFVSRFSPYKFTAEVNREVEAVFHPIMKITADRDGDIDIEWPVSANGWVLQESSLLAPDSWTDSTALTTDTADKRKATTPRPSLGDRGFYRLRHP